MRARVLALLRANLQRGIEAGCYRRDVDPDATPVLLIGMVRAGLMHLPDLPRSRVLDAVAALVLDGVRAAPRSGDGGAEGAAARGAAARGEDRS